MPSVLAFPDTPYAGVEETPGLRAFKFVAGAGQYYSTTIPSSLVQLDNCTVIVLHKPATSSGARMLLGDATGGVNTNMYVRQQNLAYRFAADYSTTDLVYNTVNAIVLNEWNWVAVIRNLAGGGAGTRIRGWYAQGLLGRWQALSFSAPTEPVGSLVNNAGFVLNTGGSSTLSNVGYDGLVALVAVIKRPLTIGEVEDFRQDPLSWREEAELFLRPGHFGPTLRDEGKSKSGPWTATGSVPGWAGTGVKDFWATETPSIDEILGAALAAGLSVTLGHAGALEVPKPLAAAVALAITSSGDLGVPKPLAAAVALAITSSGDLGVPKPLAAALALAVTTAADLTAPGAGTSLAATVALAVTSAGALDVLKPLAAAVAVAVTTAADLTAPGSGSALAAAVAVALTTGGGLTVPKPLAAGLAVSVTSTGDVLVSKPLAVAIGLTVTSAAGLTVPKPLLAALGVTVTATGNLLLPASLAAALAVSITVSGDFQATLFGLIGRMRLLPGFAATPGVVPALEATSTLAPGLEAAADLHPLAP